jgi:alanyl-tRNA synthetase
MPKYHNAFLFEDKDTVRTTAEKDGFLYVELDDTIFYPGGGGQPCDLGIITGQDFFGEVVEVYKETTKIFHKVRPKHGILKAGDIIDLKINEDRRIKLLRMHTGEHVLFKSLELNLGDITLNKIDLDDAESSLFINANTVSWEKLFKAEELANRIIEEDRQILEKEYTKEEALRLPNLRIKAERIPGDFIRVVEVKDFDWSACAGTHAKTTGFVGNILITKFNLNKGSFELRFKTNVKKDFFDLSRISRETSTFLGVEPAGILPAIKRIQDESESYKEKFRKVSAKLLDYNKEEKINDLIFVYNIVEGLEKKQLVDKAAVLVKENTIVFFVNYSEGKATVLLSIHPGLKMNAPELLNKLLLVFNGKGGGRDSFAMGSCDEMSGERIVEEAKKILISEINN